ncbi:MAG TPA: sulfotransferase [Pirellulales bacterium]|jgi:hypothetical protein|nr:sulfotransferase [Pirellulales bacterium]
MTTASPTPAEPGPLAALVDLAEREQAAGRFAEATEAYRQIIALRPDLAEAHNNLGYALEQQGQLDNAAAEYRRAVALDPRLFQAHENLGNVARRQRKLDQAVVHYEQALVGRPDLAVAYNHLGNVLKEQGKFDDAAARYDQALALAPDRAEAHYDRADLKTFRTGDADLAALEAIAQGGRLPPDKMLYVHFALGKALDDVGDYRRGFEHLLQGNALKRREVDYHEAAFHQTFRRIAERFDRELLDRVAAVGDRSPAPIFIVGMPRSGSTLVEQILASHPQVEAGDELPNLGQVVRSIGGAGGRAVPFPQSIENLAAEDWRRLGEAYLASLPTLGAGKTRITDKMLSNFAYIGLIRLILPAARIIHAVRDPVDTCVSCFSKLFTAGAAFSYDLAELGRYYRMYGELMEHWRSVLPAGAMLEVVYEEVVDNVDRQARRLIDYCGLPWDDRCLTFHETGRPIATASNVQARRPLYRSSVARWRRYEEFLGPLLAELGGP